MQDSACFCTSSTVSRKLPLLGVPSIDWEGSRCLVLQRAARAQLLSAAEWQGNQIGANDMLQLQCWCNLCTLIEYLLQKSLLGQASVGSSLTLKHYEASHTQKKQEDMQHVVHSCVLIRLSTISTAYEREAMAGLFLVSGFNKVRLYKYLH